MPRQGSVCGLENANTTVCTSAKTSVAIFCLGSLASWYQPRPVAGPVNPATVLPSMALRLVLEYGVVGFASAAVRVPSRITYSVLVTDTSSRSG